MYSILKVTLIGLSFGLLGTVIGGLGIYFVNDRDKTLLALLNFSAGVMLSVVCFDLIPHALSATTFDKATMGMILGMIAMLASRIMLDRYVKTLSANKFLRTGIMLTLGVALHNFPEGLAVGSGFEASLGLGFSLILVITIHDIPEGLAIALPLKKGGMGNMKIFLYTVLSGLPMGMGAFVGSAMGKISYEFIGVCLGFSAGAMLYMVFVDLLPHSRDMRSVRLSAVSCAVGIALGIILSVGI